MLLIAQLSFCFTEEHMHSILKVALRSSSDNKEPTAFPEFTPSFPASTRCHQGGLNKEFTHFFQPFTCQGEKTSELPSTGDMLANAGREAKGSLSQQSCCQSSHMQNCPSSRYSPHPEVTTVPSQQIIHSHTFSTPVLCSSHQQPGEDAGERAWSCPRRAKALF